MLVDGIEKSLKLQDPYTEEYKIKIEIIFFKDLGEREVMYLDENIYFKMESDPTNYF